MNIIKISITNARNMFQLPTYNINLPFPLDGPIKAEVVVDSLSIIAVCDVNDAFPAYSGSDVTMTSPGGIVLLSDIVTLFVASISVTGDTGLRKASVSEDDVRFGEREYSVMNFETSLLVVVVRALL